MIKTVLFGIFYFYLSFYALIALILLISYAHNRWLRFTNPKPPGKVIYLSAYLLRRAK